MKSLLFTLLTFFGIGMSPPILGNPPEYIDNAAQNFSCDEYPKIVEGVRAKDTHSLHKLAILYYRGWCIDKDESQSFMFFVAAAQQGSIPSFYNAALMLHLGVGVNQDIDKATDMLRQLLELNHVKTQRYVCNSYVHENLNESWV